MVDQYLTRKQLAERLNMTEDAIRGLMRRGHLKLGKHYFKPTPKVLRFRWSACERWLITATKPETEQQQDLTEEELHDDLKAHAATMLSRAARS